tara:strand:+ start:1149 stop:1904 length:756 start_codon:yes stop_codon:yes gene_type:complete
MKKIVLIGCNGILGKYFFRKLKKKSKILVAADIDVKKNIKSKKFYKSKLNVENEEEVKLFFEEILKKFGKFDVLINNAALTSERIKKISKSKNIKENFDKEIWDKTNNVNLGGTFLAIKYFIKLHGDKKINQKIINMGSIYGSFSPHHSIYTNQKFYSSLSYSASKSGIIGLTKWLAASLANKNTTCNMITPGGVFNKQNKKFTSEYSKLLPINKMARESDVYGLLKFLISNDSNYITGQNIFVDGGFSIW